MKEPKPIWRRWDLALVAGSIAVGLVFIIAMAVVASLRDLSPLELVLFQIIALGISLGGGIFGSYKFGQSSAANKQFARSALRSVIVLQMGILELSRTIGQFNARNPDRRLELLQVLIRQLATVCSSAIADWRDVIPDDFEDVGDTLEQSKSSQRSSENDGSI